MAFAQIIVVTFIILLFFYWYQRQSAIKVRLNPLENAQIVLNEQDIATSTPVPLHGRPDQVIRLNDGRHLPIDTKNRPNHRVYPSDITQLSVYAVILANNGHSVCDFGLMRFPAENGKHVYVKVKLYSQDKVIDIYNHYQHIKNGHQFPICTCGKHTVAHDPSIIQK